MKLTDLGLLTDENIHDRVKDFLRVEGFDVLHVRESQHVGATDEELLRISVQENRVVVTHDNDFGRLALLARQPIVGILFLRPGHIDPQFTIDTISVVLKHQFGLKSPFVLVAHRRADRVRLRLRTW